MQPERSFIYCIRVRDMADPAPESVSMRCSYRHGRYRCKHLVWVHPQSVEIAILERASIVCMAHGVALAARARLEGEPSFIVVHPLQEETFGDFARENFGAVSLAEARERAERLRG